MSEFWKSAGFAGLETRIGISVKSRVRNLILREITLKNRQNRQIWRELVGGLP
jgi:hypothetical protein